MPRSLHTLSVALTRQHILMTSPTQHVGTLYIRICSFSKVKSDNSNLLSTAFAAFLWSPDICNCDKQTSMHLAQNYNTPRLTCPRRGNWYKPSVTPRTTGKKLSHCCQSRCVTGWITLMESLDFKFQVICAYLIKFHVSVLETAEVLPEARVPKVGK